METNYNNKCIFLTWKALVGKKEPEDGVGFKTKTGEETQAKRLARREDRAANKILKGLQ